MLVPARGAGRLFVCFNQRGLSAKEYVDKENAARHLKYFTNGNFRFAFILQQTANGSERLGKARTFALLRLPQNWTRQPQLHPNVKTPPKSQDLTALKYFQKIRTRFALTGLICPARSTPKDFGAPGALQAAGIGRNQCNSVCNDGYAVRHAHDELVADRAAAGGDVVD